MILYFDPFMGIAGDMTVAALVDLGADGEAVNAALAKLNLGLSFSFGTVERQGLRATHALASFSKENSSRNLREIQDILEAAQISGAVRATASAAFRKLAEAEAAVHGCQVDEVHFHEVGASDAIADIVGACAAWESIGSPPVECGPLNLGSGFTVMEHGTFPVPPPAVAELVKGAPVFSFGEPVERTTPTGAALALALSCRFGPLPSGTIQAVGYGAGTRDTRGAPNVLRAFLLAKEPASSRVSVLETQLDDMSPELLAGALEEIRRAGALDVFVTAIQMKKHRQGWLVTVICGEGEERRLADLVFENTTTLGIRIKREERLELLRETATEETPFGPLRVKVATLPSGKARRHYEWDDIEALAKKKGIPPLELLAKLK